MSKDDSMRDRLADALAYRPGSSAYDYANRVLPLVTNEIRESMHVGYAAGLDIADKIARDYAAAETKLDQIRSIVNEYRSGAHWSSQGMERIAALLEEPTR